MKDEKQLPENSPAWSAGRPSDTASAETLSRNGETREIPGIHIPAVSIPPSEVSEMQVPVMHIPAIEIPPVEFDREAAAAAYNVAEIQRQISRQNYDHTDRSVSAPENTSPHKDVSDTSGKTDVSKAEIPASGTQLSAPVSVPENTSAAETRSPPRTERRHMQRREEDRKKEAVPVQTQSGRQAGKPVIVYILLLFTLALLLMAYSSLMHQRNNSEALGQLQSSVSNMQEIQDFQERIIALQEARQEAENQLREVQRDMTSLVSQTQEDRNRAEAFSYFYLLMMEYQSGRYQSCQALIQKMESDGLMEYLPAEIVPFEGATGVISPLERFREIKSDTTARIAEGLTPQTVVPDVPAVPVFSEDMDSDSPDTVDIADAAEDSGILQTSDSSDLADSPDVSGTPDETQT